MSTSTARPVTRVSITAADVVVRSSGGIDQLHPFGPAAALLPTTEFR